MREIYTNHLIRLKDRKKISFSALEAQTGISDSTLCRWFKGEGNPTVDDLERVFQALGSDMQGVFAEVGEQEMRASEQLDFKGTEAMLADFSRREAVIREDYERQLTQQIDLRNTLQLTFESAVATMAGEHAQAIAQLTAELHEAQRRADQIDAKRHNVFWGMLAALGLVTVAFVVALFHDAVF